MTSRGAEGAAHPSLGGPWRGWVLAAFALLLAACGAASVRWQSSWNAPGATFEGDGRADFAEARAALDAGRRMEALDRLRRASAESPDNLEVGAWLQDLELDLLEDGVDLFAPRFGLDADGAAEVLRRVYGARADETPTVPSLVLAARVETDVIAAETLLQRALELDPTSPWAHYGQSHVLLEDRTRSDRWNFARTALERALALDPGHIRARRLEAWMAAQEGRRDVAESLIAHWLDVVRGDPRVPRADEVDALLDFALLLLLRGENGRATRILEDLEGEPIGRPRRLMLLTVARQEAGDVLGALDTALAAQGASRETVLPLVQEALLHELFLNDPRVADERWDEIARLTEEASGISDLIQGLRARVRVERRRALEDQARGAQGGREP